MGKYLKSIHFLLCLISILYRGMTLFYNNGSMGTCEGVYMVVITGTETFELKSTAPLSALIEFYRAFNSKDLTLMGENWEKGNDSVMSNPVGGITRGWEDIESVYRNLFDNDSEIYVEFYDYTIHKEGNLFWAIGREKGLFKKGRRKVDLEIRTSRTFRYKKERWRQIHHHGSIENPKLLARYQRTVFGEDLY